MRKASDGSIVGWILSKNDTKYRVLMDNYEEKIYDKKQLPEWICFLFENGIGIQGREYEESEVFSENEDFYEVAEILMKGKTGRFLVRYKGFQMQDAEWISMKDLKNCLGLVSAFTYELEHGKTIANMMPTKRWLETQGAGSRLKPCVSKTKETLNKVYYENGISKNRKWYQAKTQKLIYLQNCLYETIDSEFPYILPKAAARSLRNASKLCWHKFKVKVADLLEKYNTQLMMNVLFEYEKCSKSLKNMLKIYKNKAVFVVYKTKTQFHTGLFKNGKISPYKINDHTVSKKKSIKKMTIDFQKEFLEAVDQIPERAIAFCLEKCIPPPEA